MKHHNRIMPILFILPMITLAGCVNDKTENEPRPNVRPMVDAIQQADEDWIWISGQRWHLTSIEGNPAITDTSLDLNFKEHTWLEGNAGCNRYTASYIHKAEAGLQIKEILSTRMFCAQPAGIMQQESRYFQLLKQVDTYHAQPDELSMFIDGDKVLTFGTGPEEDSP